MYFLVSRVPKICISIEQTKNEDSDSGLADVVIKMLEVFSEKK